MLDDDCHGPGHVIPVLLANLEHHITIGIGE